MIALDDNIEDHPKFVSLSNDAFALWIRCIGYCRRNMTDGFIPAAAAHARARCRDPRKPIAELTAPPVGSPHGNPLWTAVAGGYQIHDYLRWNPSKVQVEAQREQKRAAGRHGGQRSGEARRQQPATNDQARPKQDRSEGEAECFASGSPVANPDPDPIRIRSGEISPETGSLSSTPGRARAPEGESTTTGPAVVGDPSAEAVLAELQRHPKLRMLATPATAAEVLGLMLAGALPLADVLAAIAALAFDLVDGTTEAQARKALRGYVTRAKSYAECARSGGQGPPHRRAASDRQPMPPHPIRELTPEESPDV